MRLFNVYVVFNVCHVLLSPSVEKPNNRTPFTVLLEQFGAQQQGISAIKTIYTGRNSNLKLYIQTTKGPKISPYRNRKWARCTTWFLTPWSNISIAEVHQRDVTLHRYHRDATAVYFCTNMTWRVILCNCINCYCGPMLLYVYSFLFGSVSSLIYQFVEHCAYHYGIFTYVIFCDSVHLN